MRRSRSSVPSLVATYKPHLPRSRAATLFVALGVIYGPAQVRVLGALALQARVLTALAARLAQVAALRADAIIVGGDVLEGHWPPSSEPSGSRDHTAETT